MALVVGTLLALAVGLFATALGMDRERSFYPTVTIVVASLYALFAILGGSTPALVREVAVGVVFVAAAASVFRSSLWIVALALAAHGIFDFLHGRVIANPGVPPWWPAFCGSYDVTAAAYLAVLIKLGRTRAQT